MSDAMHIGMIVRARALIPSVTDRGQCEAQREYRYLGSWEARHPDKQCRHAAKFEINGKRYCAKHAGVIALRTLLDGAIKETTE